MKKLRALLFSRLLLVAVALIAQAVFFSALIVVFYNRLHIFYASSLLISAAVIIGIVSGNRNPAYKLAWVIPILLFPVFGGIFYIFIGHNRLTRRTRKRLTEILHRSFEALPELADTIPPGIQTSFLDNLVTHQSRYLAEYAQSPLCPHTRSLYLPDGETNFQYLLDELRKAQRYIFMEYFIITPGKMWDAILEVLTEKAASGVDVRLIYDDVGCLPSLSAGYPKKLKKLGIRCAVFNPVRPILHTSLNNRDHRKITVIDGTTAFTGGINLADEYINAISPFGHWKDAGIMLTGDAAWSFTVLFLGMWDFLAGEDKPWSWYRFSQESGPGDGLVQPFADTPLDNESVGENVYLNMILKASDYLYITTPYLVIDNEMLTALTLAAKCGLDVRIMTPGRCDKWYVHAVTRSWYKTLLESGIRIFEYSPGFIHSKTFVADDRYGVVGTINMDFRSLYLHFECGVCLYHSSAVLEIRRDFLETAQRCTEITLESIKTLPLSARLLGRFLRIFAPLM